MKKIFASLLTAMLILISFAPAASVAEFDPNSVSTPYVLLMDAASGSVLFEKKGYTLTYPASTTKVMTCIIALEKIPDLDTEITVGEAVTRGSVLGMTNGEKMPLREMLYGLMLKSGNDCAKAIAEHIAGSVESFASLMNEKAAELGMKDTHFVTPHGMHDDNHKTTAYDMALLTRYAMQNSDFRAIVKTTTREIPATNKDSNGYSIYNHNKLIYMPPTDTKSFVYQYATGVKTGDTTQAGRCLIATAQKDGKELILILFGDYENKVDGNLRFKNAASLFDWGFENSVEVDISSLNLTTTYDVAVNGASFEDQGNGMLTLNADLSAVKYTTVRSLADALRTNAASIKMTANISGAITAPVEEGAVLGTATYEYDGKILFKVDLKASRSVAPLVAAPNASNAPSPTQLINTPNPEDVKEANPLLFWILLVVVILVIVIVVRVLATRNSRRRARKRSKKNYRVYRQ